MLFLEQGIDSYIKIFSASFESNFLYKIFHAQQLVQIVAEFILIRIGGIGEDRKFNPFLPTGQFSPPK